MKMPVSVRPGAHLLCGELFSPFASGAERQALVQGAELAHRGHTVHVVTRAVPGYPIVDEEHQGIFIHRWIKTATAGPLFGLSFVAGVMAALKRLRAEIDVIHTHQGLWEAVATGLARSLLAASRPWFNRRAAGYYGEADELRRTRAAPLLRRAILANTGFAAISAEIDREWRELGVAPRADRPHGQRRRCPGLPPGPQYGRGRSAAPPARDFHRPPPSAEEFTALARSVGQGCPPQQRQLDLGRARQRSPAAHRAGGFAAESPIAFSLSGPSTVPPSTFARPTSSSCPASPRE